MRRSQAASTLAVIAVAAVTAGGGASALAEQAEPSEPAAAAAAPATDGSSAPAACEAEAVEPAAGEVGEEAAECAATEPQGDGTGASGEGTSGEEAAAPSSEALAPAAEAAEPEEASKSEGQEAQAGTTISAAEARSPQGRQGQGGKGGRNGGVSAPADAAGNRRSESAEVGETEGGGTSSEVEAEAGGSLSSISSIGTGTASLASFDVPVSLLPVYQACGSAYGISWEVLAAINKVETGFGTNLGTSGAGAEGWMQFLPSSWRSWGVDADGNGRKETDDPVDAICAAARYLAASGGESDIYQAIFAYNHADWYVREVLSYAREYERVPANLINSLSELAAGSTFPVSGKSSYWSDEEAGDLLSTGALGEATISSQKHSRGAATIDASRGSRVLAVVDGTVAKVTPGGYLVLRDAYGDRIAYYGVAGVKVRRGERVAAGDVLGKVDSSIGIAVEPDGSSHFDTRSLLAVWKQGGVGRIYQLDGRRADGRTAATVQALLGSDRTLEKRVLADRDLTLPRCLRAAVRGGEVRRQTLASLEYLTAQGHEIGLGTSTCKGGSGFSVEIAAVDGTAVAGHQGRGTASYAVARELLALEGGMLPQRIVSAMSLGGSAVASQKHEDAIEVDYNPPQKARIVDGKAIAPTDAPAAVQAIIAAANQISDEPYVWGGGHGAWVSAGYDCSGSVSYVLHAAGMLSTPLTSGQLESWGESGSGRWITVYANSEHTYAVVAGIRWDTVGDLSGSGPRWHDQPPYPEGFTVRHPAGY